MSDGADVHEQRRFRWAVALLVLGVFAAFVPGLVAGDRFVSLEYDRTAMQETVLLWDRVQPAPGSHDVFVPVEVIIPDGVTSLTGIASRDAAWAIGIVTLLFAPFLFVWWRRSAVGFGRVAGAVCCAAAGCEFSALVLTRLRDDCWSVGGIWWTVPLGAALMGAAFLVAPAPRRRDDA